jgi:hypothetical protein
MTWGLGIAQASGKQLTAGAASDSNLDHFDLLVVEMRQSWRWYWEGELEL